MNKTAKVPVVTYISRWGPNIRWRPDSPFVLCLTCLNLVSILSLPQKTNSSMKIVIVTYFFHNTTTLLEHDLLTEQQERTETEEKLVVG